MIRHARASRPEHMIVLACLVIGCAQDGPASEPCARRPAADLAEGPIVLDDAGAADCTVVFEPTGIELRSDPDGARPDPGPAIVRDSRGRFYSANARGFPATVAVFDSTGQFVRTIGRPGEGPGELSSRGGLSLLVDSADRLHVRDGGISWSVFSPEHEFLSRVPWDGGGTSGQAIVLANGVVIQNALPGESRLTDWFQMRRTGIAEDAANGTGTGFRSFAPVAPAVAAGQVYAEAQLAYAGGNVFWAGPSRGDGRGYVIDEWTTDGELRRSFRRDVDWFPEGQIGRAAPDERPLPAITVVRSSGDGLLLVIAIVPNDNWRYIADPGEASTERQSMADVVVEVIDTRNATVVATDRAVVADVISIIPRGLFDGQPSGYRLVEDSEGLPVARIVDYRVTPR